MYKMAVAHEDVIFYFDICGNKYVASGGSIAWRINNPGLVPSHSHFSREYGAIGSFKGLAIFPNPESGRKAFADWLHSKKYFKATLKAIATHYQPHHSKTFADRLSLIAEISQDKKLNTLSPGELNRLLKCIEKLSEYTRRGTESFVLLPKITAKIETAQNQDDRYLIGDDIVLSKQEAIDWILSYRLDAIIVHANDGKIHLRSRPMHCIGNIKMKDGALSKDEGTIDTLIRTVGEKRHGQCIWGFINGIRYTKDEAIKAAIAISQAAEGEQLFFMPNDTVCLGLKDVLVCGALKIALDPHVVHWAVKFFRFLLARARESSVPVVVFVHSQGAIISEHALELFDNAEREKIRIFTFGGGSFIERGKGHPESHNYASAADFVCRIGSPNLQCLALRLYYGQKGGLDHAKVIQKIAFEDAILDLDTTNPETIEAYVKARTKHYQKELAKLENITVLDPDPDSNFKHRFSSDCYQNKVKEIIQRYRM